MMNFEIFQVTAALLFKTNHLARILEGLRGLPLGEGCRHCESGFPWHLDPFGLFENGKS